MSTSAKDENLLNLIVGEITVIGQIRENNDEAAFVADQILQRAAVMALLNIGELAAHLGPEVREAGGAIPWKKIIGLRNLAAHGYFILDMRDIWKTLAEDVPTLKSEVSKLISG